VAQVAAHLARHPLFATATQQLAAQQGDPCRPVLLLHVQPDALGAIMQQGAAQQHGRTARGNAAAAVAAGAWPQGIVVRLLPVLGLDAFEVSRLAPDRNNVRWLTAAAAAAAAAAAGGAKRGAAAANGQQRGGKTDTEAEPQLPPTPHYNAAILADMLLLSSQHTQAAAAAAAGGARFVDALLLLKVWCQQHGVSSQGVLPSAIPACYGTHQQQQQQQQQQLQASAAPSPLAAAAAVQADAFSGHLLAALLSTALNQAGAASAAGAMTPLQQMRCALQLLADRAAWSKGALALPRDASVPPELRALHQQHSGDAAANAAAAGAAAPVPGQVSRDHAKLQAKLQQQAQQLPAPAPAAGVFRKQYDATLLDASGHLNLAAGVSAPLLQLAQRAAAQSLAVLARPDLEPDAGYAAGFRPGAGLAQAFDYWWTVELPAAASTGQPGDQAPMRCVGVCVCVCVCARACGAGACCSFRHGRARQLP
jgi:U3 small nucleolar RNA-associated protein 22